MKDCLASRDVLQHLTYYMIDAGRIYAANGRMMASTPFIDLGERVLIPGELFERFLLAAPAGEPDIRIEDLQVKIKAGRFKAQMRTIHSNLWPAEDQPQVMWKKIPEGFMQALADLRPFVSENAAKPWATCIGIQEGFFIATNNIVIARTQVEYAGPAGLLPVWAVDFLLKHADNLRAWSLADNLNAIWFAWKSGGYLKVQMVADVFPPAAAEIIDQSAEPTLELTAEWKAAYSRVAPFASGGTIAFYSDRVVGDVPDKIEVEDVLENPLPEGEEKTVWDPNFLSPVIEQATHWDPIYWPLPCPFRTERLQGVVAGRRQ